MFPEDQYIGEMAQNTYFTIHLYAKAARLAGTTDQATVRLQMVWDNLSCLGTEALAHWS